MSDAEYKGMYVPSIDRLREVHIPHEKNTKFCAYCNTLYPCQPLVLLARAEEAEAELARLRGVEHEWLLIKKVIWTLVSFASAGPTNLAAERVRDDAVNKVDIERIGHDT